MRQALLLASILMIAAGVAHAQSDSFGQQKGDSALTKLALGKKIPGKLSMTTIDGKTKSFADLRGKVVVVTFWSDSCPYLKNAEPKLKKLHAMYASKGVEMITIAANQREIADKAAGYSRIKKHLEKNSVKFPIYVDHGNKVTDLFGAKTTPHCYVVAADGTLSYAGALDDDPRDAKGVDANAYVKTAVDQLLASKPVTTSSTKPYG